MSFDIVFSSCRSGGTKEVVNPFTGETGTVAAAGPLTPEEKKAVQDFLAEHGYKPAVVSLPDGVLIEVNLDDDLSGGMICLRDATPDVFSFLFQLADAGNYMLCPIMEDNSAIVTTSEASQSAGDSGLLEPDAIVHIAKDPHSIAEIIYPAFGDWDAYRNRVIDESKDS